MLVLDKRKRLPYIGCMKNLTNNRQHCQAKINKAHAEAIRWDTRCVYCDGTTRKGSVVISSRGGDLHAHQKCHDEVSK